MNTLIISRNDVKRIPDAALTLIAMGFYSLYKVAHPNPEIEYILRTDAKTLYGLKSDGTAIEIVSETKIEVLSRVRLSDAPIYAVDIGQLQAKA